MGKFTTHRSAWPSRGTFSASAICRRKADSTALAISGASAANSRRSPGSTSISDFRAAHSSSVKNFLMGLFSWPSVVNATQAMPLAPLASAMEAIFSTSPRLQSPAPLALMAFTTPPDWATDENTLKPVFFTMSVISCRSMPKRTSGRSQP